MPDGRNRRTYLQGDRHRHRHGKGPWRIRKLMVIPIWVIWNNFPQNYLKIKLSSPPPQGLFIEGYACIWAFLPWREMNLSVTLNNLSLVQQGRSDLSNSPRSEFGDRRDHVLQQTCSEYSSLSSSLCSSYSKVQSSHFWKVPRNINLALNNRVWQDQRREPETSPLSKETPERVGDLGILTKCVEPIFVSSLEFCVVTTHWLCCKSGFILMNILTEDKSAVIL